MIEDLIKEYYELKEAKELLDYLIFTKNLLPTLDIEAAVKVQNYYKIDDSV